MEMDATSVLALSVAIDRAAPSALQDAIAEIERLKAALDSAERALGEVADNHFATLSLLATELERNMERFAGIEEALQDAGSHSQVLAGVLNAVTRP